MTKFIDSYATSQLLPPWESTDSTCWCFAIPLPHGSVKAYLDKYFNIHRRTDSEQYFFDELNIKRQYGLIVVCEQPKIRSKAKGRRHRVAGHTEVYLSIPVRRRKIDRSDPKKLGRSTIVWVQPFAFGNNSYVMFGAREVWGLDVNLARIDICQPLIPELYLDLSIMGMKTFSPQSEATLIPCLYVSTGRPISQQDPAEPEVPEPSDSPSKSSGIDAFRKALGKNGYPVPVPTSPFEDVIKASTLASSPPEAQNKSPSKRSQEALAKPKAEDAAGGWSRTYNIRLDNVKQFRDVYDMNAAVYRGIVESLSQHTDLNSLYWYNPKKVEIVFYWSASIKEMVRSLFGDHGLTLKPPSAAHPGWDSCPLQVDLAYSFKSTVNFKVLKTLCTYEPDDP